MLRVTEETIGGSLCYQKCLLLWFFISSTGDRIIEPFFCFPVRPLQFPIGTTSRLFLSLRFFLEEFWRIALWDIGCFIRFGIHSKNQFFVWKILMLTLKWYFLKLISNQLFSSSLCMDTLLLTFLIYRFFIYP